MRAATLLLAASALLAQTPQDSLPEISAGGIVSQGAPVKLLAPGAVVELYGKRLAPEPWCGQNANPPAPYPAEICGVRVLVGKTPAALLFVSPGQINLEIPDDAPAQGTAPIEVCLGGACSPPLAMPFSAHKAFLRLESSANARMPVWMEIQTPAPYLFKYPCADSPWSFDGFEFELRRDGKPIVPAPVPHPRASLASSGGICREGAQPSPFPLHLLYRFDQAGAYAVRLARIQPAPSGANPAVPDSDWLEFPVAAESDAARDSWLQSMADKLKSAPPDTLIMDVIPSLLAWPDEKALKVLLPLLGIPPPTSPADRMGQAGRFARLGLAAFPEETLRSLIPPDKLLDYCPPNGACAAER